MVVLTRKAAANASMPNKHMFGGVGRAYVNIFMQMPNLKWFLVLAPKSVYSF